MGNQKVLKSNLPGLVLITDSQRLPGERFFEVVSEALAGGVDAVLVREKQMDSARLLAFASRLRKLTADSGAKLIIHTQADVARAIGADGVHLPSIEMNQTPDIRNWLQSPEMTVSVSCHNEIELEFAREFGADYAFLSPVFPTQSHPGEPHLGIKLFTEMAERAALPVIALGGINRDNRDQLKGFPVAIIGAILDADDPRAAAAGLI